MNRRSLEELNVLDDFLFQEMIRRGEEGENFCRILLSTILGKNIRNVKVTAQKSIAGISPNRHGIKIDAYIEAVEDITDSKCKDIEDVEIQTTIYDIEPNKYRTDSEARRTRYYHSLIDSKILKSGIGYEKLRKVVVIMILPYDPFGKKRMVYRFKTKCMEDDSIEYDDGIETIYLYTKGEEGIPGKDLRDMLKYIEKSTEENVTDKNLREIHRLVNDVRRDEEVGVSYMKSWELEAIFIKQGEIIKLISLIRKKSEKGMSSAEIADIIEETTDFVEEIKGMIAENPMWDDEQICEEYMEKTH